MRHENNLYTSKIKTEKQFKYIDMKLPTESLHVYVLKI